VLADVDDNAESRGGTISAFNGVEPIIETFADPDREAVPVERSSRLYRRGDAARRNRRFRSTAFCKRRLPLCRGRHNDQ
jgi:hypothetical protein